jgi:hypothetical protein
MALDRRVSFLIGYKTKKTIGAFNKTAISKAMALDDNIPSGTITSIKSRIN